MVKKVFFICTDSFDKKGADKQQEGVVVVGSDAAELVDAADVAGADAGREPNKLAEADILVVVEGSTQV